MTDTQALIGKRLPESAQRDAIHLAVVPVIAAERLHPGDHVGLLADGRISRIAQQLLGLVDPFLTAHVNEDDRVFLFLYPNTITSLRHHWEHPAFTATDAQPARHSAARPPTAQLEAWCRDRNVPFDDVMEAAEQYLLTGRQASINTGEDEIWLDDHEWASFWPLFEAVTGKHGRTGAPAYFTCAC